VGPRLIVLDTNYLIRIPVTGSEELKKVEDWLEQGERLACPAIAWYEFCCGPVSPREQALVLSLLAGGVLPLGEEESATAARLFNSTGRLKSLRIDCLVAATALTARAPLATSNERDFGKLVPLGLQLV